jgi:hypothetical protein
MESEEDLRCPRARRLESARRRGIIPPMTRPSSPTRRFYAVATAVLLVFAGIMSILDGRLAHDQEKVIMGAILLLGGFTTIITESRKAQHGSDTDADAPAHEERDSKDT